MDFVIVTGMSGAGKSTVLKFLEDYGYFCADNIPPGLLEKFAQICTCAGSQIERVALGMDIRGGRMFNDFSSGLKELEDAGFKARIIFLDASDEILITRYKESRRPHPLSLNGRIEDGIKEERKLLDTVKEKATYILDTSHILTRNLKEQIEKIFVDDKDFDSLMITVLSFGYKYGIPTDSDLVFDVRFIPNPFYIPALKHQTGNDEPVYSYVLNCEESVTFLEKCEDMLRFLIPCYKREGKNQLVISIGCTGGKHRSVTLANSLAKSLGNDYSVNVNHRDIDKDAKR